MKMYNYIFLIFLILYSCSKDGYTKIGLIKVNKIENNKGNLKMFYYQPEVIKNSMPLVVVLHGCTQNALEIAKETEWNKLADKYGFMVLYPEQNIINNSSSCFNWFHKNDNEKDRGEASSIMCMTDYMIDEFNIDESNIFITGMSAGAAMTIVMLSCYPEVYKSGATIAGTPYKTEEKILSEKSAEELGDYVRNQNLNFSGSYPNLMILQGMKDLVVNYKNANKIEQQWLNLFDEVVSETIIFNEGIEYFNSYKDDNLIVQKIFFKNLGHAVPIDPGEGEKQGGKSSVFAIDKNYYSSFYIADFFKLIK